MSQDTAAPPAPAPRDRRRVGRRWGRRVGLTLFAVVAALAVASRSALVRWMAERRLSLMVGGPVTMSSASLSPNGSLSMRGVRLRAPGVDGAAGTAFEARRIDVKFSWPRGILSPQADRLTLHEPVFRVSQSTSDGRLNFQGFAPNAGGATPVALPVINVVGGAVELGEHDATAYSLLFRLPISGDLRPRASDPGTYLVRFQGLPDSPPIPGRGFGPPPPTILDGEVNPTTLATRLRLTNVDLVSWGDQWAPSGARDQWAALNVEGRLEHAEFTFTQEAGAAAEVALEGVGLTLPVQPTDEAERDAPGPDEPAAPARNLRMTDVQGSIRFDRAAVTASLTGLIEDLKYRVTLVTEGLALNAPFRMEAETAEPFVVGEHPSLLPFAPPVVRERFQTFSGPTAVVDGRVSITRGAPGENGAAPPPRISGALRFRDGVARFDKFPYPISNLAGLVRFTDEEIRIESITGSNPSGTRLHADGTIIPPTEGSAVDLRIAVVDLPIDDELEAAMPDYRKGLTPALFDSEAYAKRIADGLLQSSASKAEVEKQLLAARTALAVAESKGEAPADSALREIESLERRAAIPVFDLGARATVDIRVRRAPGHGDGLWSADINATFPRAGLMPREFPYPTESLGGVVHVTDEAAHAEFHQARGATGGLWSFVADVELMNAAGERVMRPTVRIGVDDAPIDSLLIEAMPTDARTGGGAEAARILKALNLAGAIDAEVIVSPRGSPQDPNPRLGFEATVDLLAVSLSPVDHEGRAQPLIEHLHGRVHATEALVESDNLIGRLGAGSLRGSLRASFPSAGAGDAPVAGARVRARASVEGLDLASPVELFAKAFDASLGERLRLLRSTHSPAGTVNAALTLDDESFRLSFSDLRDGAADVRGGRLALAQSDGTLSVRGTEAVEFDAFGGALTFDGESLGVVHAAGAWSLDGDPARLDVDARGVRLESKALQSIWQGSLGARNSAEPPPGAPTDAGHGSEAASLVESIAGEADVRASIESGADEPRFSGVAAPRSLRFVRKGREFVFDRASGQIRFEGARGAVEALRIEGDGLAISADGTWTTAPSLALDLRLRANADRLDDRVRALLPDEALRAAESVQLSVSGPISLEDCRAIVGDAAGPETVSVAGAVRFEDASARFGLPVEDARGAFEFHARASGPAPGGAESDSAFDATLRVDSARIAGLRISGALVRVEQGDAPNEILIPLAECVSHGGRIAGAARVGPGPSGERQFEVDLGVAGVSLGHALSDLSEKNTTEEGDRDPSGDALTAGSAGGAPTPPPNRGLLDASLTLRGAVDDPSTREGRGSFAIAGGELVSMPMMTRMLEISNLTLPFGARLRETLAAFHVRGDLATFERLEVASDSLLLRGTGAVRFSDWELDMRFTSRGAFRLPILSDIFENLRDEIATITVTGTLTEPEFGTTTLSGTRAALGDAFRADPVRSRSPGRPVAPSNAPREHEDR